MRGSIVRVKRLTDDSISLNDREDPVLYDIQGELGIVMRHGDFDSMLIAFNIHSDKCTSCQFVDLFGEPDDVCTKHRYWLMEDAVEYTNETLPQRFTVAALTDYLENTGTTL